MDMKKLSAEFIGTMTLVLVGCGTAMLVGCDSVNGCGYILTAFAFGLVIVGMAYCVGNVSGCHINPAVSFACLIDGRMKIGEFFGYCIAQICGALVGSGFLWLIFEGAGIEDKTGKGGFGSNGLAGVNNSLFIGLVVEFLLTFIFVLVILGVTSDKAKHGSFGGIIIGFALVMVHILGIGLTGTSVNPARSIGPAIFSTIEGNFNPITCLWVFVVGPMCGGGIAAFVHRAWEGRK